MKLWMRIVVPFTAVMSIAVGAQAQMWGAGVYGGMQSCPYPYQAAAGATEYSDEIREAKNAIEELNRELRAKKTEKKRVDRDLDRYRKDIEKSVSSDYTDVIFNHMENQANCSDYTGFAAANEETVVQGEEGGQTVRRPTDKKLSFEPFSADQWGSVCGDKGIVNKSVCSDPQYKEEGRRGNGGSCGKAIVEFRKTNKKSGQLQGDIEALEDLIRAAKDDKKVAEQNARDEIADRQREQLEGGVCLDCLTRNNSYQYERPATDWASVIGNVGVGLASIYMGYRTNKQISNANANIGWPTDPWAAQGYGYGFGAIGTGLGQAIGGGSGIYGAMGGGIGQGGFGCAGNNGGPYGMMGPYGGMNGNGMWGNPYGMAGMGFPGMGGGMYNPGMGPWGMAGPWGGMGGGYPGGMMMGGMMGYPMGGGMMGNMMGYPMGGSMMGGMIGGMMGGPMGSMMGGGMMGYPMGGGMMGYPMGGGMMGNMIGGMMGGPMGSMMGGGMMGYPMGGSMMGGMLGGGYMMGGMMGGPLGGGMMGYPMGGMMGNMMGGAYMGGMGMQQQMMQMQMQQYQMYMQQQQQYVQQQMQRQQVVASLQQELYGLLYRIQQVQYGGGYIGGSIGSGIGVGGGIGIGIGTNIGGSGITPLPGNGSAIGTGSAAPIPAPR